MKEIVEALEFLIKKPEVILFIAYRRWRGV